MGGEGISGDLSVKRIVILSFLTFQWHFRCYIPSRSLAFG